jgi:hypothetical protein
VGLGLDEGRFHAGRSVFHSGHRRSSAVRGPFGEQSPNISGGDMALNDVSLDDSGVAGGVAGRDALACLNGATLGTSCTTTLKPFFFRSEKIYEWQDRCSGGRHGGSRRACLTQRSPVADPKSFDVWRVVPSSHWGLHQMRRCRSEITNRRGLRRCRQ